MRLWCDADALHAAKNHDVQADAHRGADHTKRGGDFFAGECVAGYADDQRDDRRRCALERTARDQHGQRIGQGPDE